VLVYAYKHIYVKSLKTSSASYKNWVCNQFKTWNDALKHCLRACTGSGLSLEYSPCLLLASHAPVSLAASLAHSSRLYRSLSRPASLTRILLPTFSSHCCILPQCLRCWSVAGILPQPGPQMQVSLSNTLVSIIRMGFRPYNRSRELRKT
jgi:hypothetical protein